MNDEELLTGFESCSMPLEQWDHRAHVRVAYLYASRESLNSATDRMRLGLKAYVAKHNVPDGLDRGYHETVTQVFMRLVYAAARQAGPFPCSDDFCDAHPQLLDKRALRKFYSAERIKTRRAKSEFVEPDLAPLPAVRDDANALIKFPDAKL